MVGQRDGRAGGTVAGGKIYGAWPGLAPEQLEERVDLAVEDGLSQRTG